MKIAQRSIVIPTLGRNLGLRYGSRCLSSALRVGEACLKDIRHDILALVALMVQLILYYYLLVMMRFPPLSCLRASASPLPRLPLL